MNSNSHQRRARKLEAAIREALTYHQTTHIHAVLERALSTVPEHGCTDPDCDLCAWKAASRSAQEPPKAKRETFEEMDARIKAEVRRDEIDEGVLCDCGVGRGTSHYCSALDHCWIGAPVAVSRSRAPQEDWVTEESALRSSLDGCTKRVQELFTRTKVAEAALALANKEVERQKALMLEQTKLGTSFFDSYIEEREAKNELRAALALQVQENSELKRTIELFASTEEAKAMLAGFDDLKAGRLSSWTGRCEARTDVFGRCDLSAGHQGPHVNAIGDMWYWPSAAAPVKEHT